MNDPCSSKFTISIAKSNLFMEYIKLQKRNIKHQFKIFN